MKRDSNCFDPNWAVYFLWAVLQLYSITKPSANVQMRSIKDAITYGLRKVNYKDVINNEWLSVEKMCFLFLCFLTLTARDDTRDRTQIVRAKKKFELDLWASLDPVSQWYVYPRDMCFPVHISLVICVSLQYSCQWNVYPLPATPPNKRRFYFCCFCEFCESSSKGLQMIQDYEQHNRQKSNDSRQNNRKAVSGEFTSSWAAMLM